MSFLISMGRVSSLDRLKRGGGILPALGLMAAVLLILALHEWPDEVQPLLDSGQSLAPGETRAQPLTLSKDGLYRLDVALTRKGMVSGQVILCVTTDSAGSEEIASVRAPAERAEDLSQAIRRPYTFVDFRLSSNEIIPSGPVWLWLESQASAPVGVRGVKSTENGFRFALKTYYRRSAIDNLMIFLFRLNGRSIYAGLLLFLYAALVAVWTHIFCLSQRSLR